MDPLLVSQWNLPTTQFSGSYYDSDKVKEIFADGHTEPCADRAQVGQT